MSRPLDGLDLTEIGRLIDAVEIGEIAAYAIDGHVRVKDAANHVHHVPLRRSPPRDRAEEFVRRLERYGYTIVRSERA